MAGAQPSSGVDTAGELYDRGVAAQKKGDYARAASLFARADELVPDATALEAAINAAVLAGDAPLAMSLVHRTRRAAMPQGLASAARKAEAQFGSRVGTLRIKCADCSARVDGQIAPINEDRWLLVGAHRVELAVADRQEVFEVEITARARAEIAPSARIGASEAAPGQAAEPSEGIQPGWFWAGVGVTALFAGLSIASGIDALDRHAEFEKNPTTDLSEKGEAAETRTYVLWTVTGLLAAGTAALGLFAVRWSDPPKAGSGATSTASFWATYAPKEARSAGGGAAGVSVRTTF